MKKSHLPFTKQLMLLMAALFLTGAAFSQNTTISDVSTHSADASAVLDVYADPSATTRLGVLLPRLNSAPNHTSLATGLLYYKLGSNAFNYYDGSNWKTMAITDDIYWSRNATSGWVYPKFVSDFVGIGTTHPANGLTTWLTIRDVVGTYPQFHILTNVNTADASMKYSIWDGEKEYSHGIFNDPNNSATYNFKICNTGSLTGPGYTDPNTMMEIHDEDFWTNGVAGIIDFNHQSRARTHLNNGQAIPSHTWQPIDFDASDYDEHSEFIVTGGSSNQGGPPTNFFTATEEGYYQVNSRTAFFLGEFEDNWWVLQDAYVSIAIYKADLQNNWSMYAQGNNLQIGQIFDPSIPEPPTEKLSFKNNNAPNVSDVVYLQAGEKIAIYAWQSSGINLFLITGKAKTYVSIHKVS